MSPKKKKSVLAVQISLQLAFVSQSSFWSQEEFLRTWWMDQEQNQITELNEVWLIISSQVLISSITSSWAPLEVEWPLIHFHISLSWASSKRIWLIDIFNHLGIYQAGFSFLFTIVIALYLWIYFQPLSHSSPSRQINQSIKQKLIVGFYFPFFSPTSQEFETKPS